jgi:hypothetical protein
VHRSERTCRGSGPAAGPYARKAAGPGWVDVRGRRAPGRAQHPAPCVGGGLVGRVVGALLPLAFVVAVSPVPILAVILMFLTPRADVTSAGFMVGWIVGSAAVTTVSSLLAAPAVRRPQPPRGYPRSASSSRHRSLTFAPGCG